MKCEGTPTQNLSLLVQINTMELKLRTEYLMGKNYIV